MDRIMQQEQGQTTADQASNGNTDAFQSLEACLWMITQRQLYDPSAARRLKPFSNTSNPRTEEMIDEDTGQYKAADAQLNTSSILLREDAEDIDLLDMPSQSTVEPWEQNDYYHNILDDLSSNFEELFSNDENFTDTQSSADMLEECPGEQDILSCTRPPLGHYEYEGGDSRMSSPCLFTSPASSPQILFQDLEAPSQ